MAEEDASPRKQTYYQVSVSSTVFGKGAYSRSVSLSSNPAMASPRSRAWDWEEAELPDDNHLLLDELEVAEVAEIARKRSFSRTSKDSSEAKRTRVAHGDSTHVAINPEVRVKEFPDEMLKADSGKLVCTACHTEISLKKSIVVSHIQTDRHKKGKERQAREKSRQDLVKQAFLSYQEKLSKDLPGTGLTAAVPVDVAVHRVQVVRSMLQAGIPLAKLDYIRPLLEKSSTLSLTESTHMAQYIPFVLEEEQGLIKEEMKEATGFTVVFDGSTRLGEALAIIVRYVDGDWRIQQRLVRFKTLAKSLNGSQLAREILTCILTTLQIKPGALVGAVRDGAAVNGAALHSVKDIMYPDVLDIVCASHTLDNVGKRFQTETLDDFAQAWIALFARSPAARLAWKDRTGVAIKSVSNTRWWSDWELKNQLLTHFGDVRPFLDGLEACPTTRDHLLDILNDPQRLVDVQMQLSIVVDAALPFVRKTYLMEGDGDIIVDAYTNLQEVATAAAMKHYPNTHAMANKIADGNANRFTQLVQNAEKCIQPAVTFFLRKFNQHDTPMFNTVRMYKAVRIFCPIQARKLQPNLGCIEELRRVPVLDNDDFIQALKDELPAYLVAVADLQQCADRLQWWNDQNSLPGWQKAARLVFTLVPSSAAAERVFSLLQAAASASQSSMLDDHLEAMLCLQFNRGRKALL